MARVRLTDKTLNRYSRYAKARYLWDTELKGFGVRLGPCRATWLLQKDNRRVNLGHYPFVSLSEARLLAYKKLYDLYYAAPAKPSATLPEVLKTYLDERNDKELSRRFNKDITPHLATGTKAEIKAILKEWADKGQLRSAQVVYAALDQFYQWAIENDHLSHNPLAEISKPKGNQSRERYLSAKEIKALWQTTEQLTYPWKQYFQFLLHTAQRRTEVATLEWSEINGETWTIPSSKTKNGKEHIVHLTAVALEILGTVPRSASSFVFSTNGKSPISGFSKARKLLPTFDKPWVIHDLRRTFASKVAELGVLPDVADRVLNHVSGTRSGVKGVYQRYEFIRERKEALEKWSCYIRG